MKHAGQAASTSWSTTEPPLGQKPQGPLPSDWDRLKGIIHTLYIEKHLPLKDIQTRMEQEYSFKAT
jgi:hypothetical protein